MSVNWSRLKEIIDANERFVLTSHVRPDCDALGSELGMAGVLESLGKHVRIVNGQATPPNLQFIDPEGKIQAIGEDVTAEQLADADVLIVLDTSAWAQLGPMADIFRQSPATKLVLDHHVSEDDLGAESFKNPVAEATGSLVVEAADALGVALSQEMAVPLFAAIATDTGWFRFPSVTSETYRTIARLIDAGARPEAIYAELYEQDSMARLLLRGRILSGARQELDGRLLYAAVRRADFEAVGADKNDTEDSINILLQVAGSHVALLFVELADNLTKVSFRSRSDFDVRALAEQFGGGGHTKAAGATLKEPISAAIKMILDAARIAMR